MAQRNPEEQAANVTPATPDQPAGKPTGNETTSKATRPDMPDHQTGTKTTNKAAATPADAEDALAQVQQIASEYYEKLGDLTADFAEQARGYLKQSRQFVGEHPASTLAGGFALGVLIGVLLGRD